MGEFHFLRPFWFLLLIPALWIIWQLIQRQRGHSGWAKLVDAPLLEQLIQQGTGQRQHLPYLLLTIAWLLAIPALAGPTWERQPTPTWQSDETLVLILDLSSSMNQKEPAPSRLERARFKLMDILKRRNEGRTALIVFSDTPFLVTPLTDDTETIINLLSALETEILPATGDRAAAALKMAVQILQKSASSSGSVLLLSDGISDIADSLSAAHQLQQHGYTLSILSVDVASTTANTHSPLLTLAQTGKGHFALLQADDGDINQLLQRFDPTLAEERATQQRVERWIEVGVWLLLPLLLLAASGFRRGWLSILIIFILPLPQPAMALEWSDLWLRPDQQAAQQFATGKHQQAAEQFQNAGWRGSALFESGDYLAAAEAFSKSGSTDADYNRGNALAKAGKLEEAVDAYQQMLQQNPDHAHAQANLKLVESLLQQPPPGSQQQSKNTDKNPEKNQDENHPQNPASQDSDSKLEQSADPAEQGAPSMDNPSPAEKIDPDSDPDSENGAYEQSPEAPETSAEGADQSIETSTLRSSEEEIALEQWLKQVPDDPAGLLRRKFLLQHQMRQQQ